MTTWHITIVFQAPHGAVITDDAIDSIHEARPEFDTVSRLPGNQLEFTVNADSESSADLYRTVYCVAVQVSTGVLGFRVEFLRGEVVRFDHWLKQIDPNGAIQTHEVTANDAALIRMMAGASFDENSTVTLPSGKTITGAEMQRWLEANPAPE